MKQIGLAVALLCVTTLAVIGHQAANVVNSSRSNIKNNLTVVSQDPDGKVHCKVSNVACTKDQIDQLNKALAGTNAAPAPILKGAPSSEAQRAAYSTTKSNIKGVALAANGSLTCVTTDGKQGPCTAAHIADLNNAAAAMPGANDGIRGVGVGLGSKKNTANK